jgi:hypothetical protein
MVKKSGEGSVAVNGKCWFMKCICIMAGGLVEAKNYLEYVDAVSLNSR